MAADVRLTKVTEGNQYIHMGGDITTVLNKINRVMMGSDI